MAIQVQVCVYVRTNFFFFLKKKPEDCIFPQILENPIIITIKLIEACKIRLLVNDNLRNQRSKNVKIVKMLFSEWYEFGVKNKADNTIEFVQCEDIVQLLAQINWVSKLANSRGK